MFANSVNDHKNVCEDLKKCMEIAQSHMSTIKQAKASGKVCRKQAVWIGLERSGSSVCSFSLV